MRTRLGLVVALAAGVIAADVRPAAQQWFVRIDDMIVDLVAIDPPGDPRFPQAHPINTAILFQAWDFGVMPVAFDSNIAQTDRDRFMNICGRWGRLAPFICVPRTTQTGYLQVTRGTASDCFSNVGQGGRPQRRQLNLDPGCWTDRTIGHEQGHALGLWHEQQRPDRDDYVTVAVDNIPTDKIGNFNRVTTGTALRAYDFLSIMHYRWNTFAIDATRATLVPRPGYEQYARTMGSATEPTDLDNVAAAEIYYSLLRPTAFPSPTETVRNRFDRAELLQVMERLHAFYMSPLGLQRPLGLSIGGRPDFLGIAAWLFDFYLGARSAGFSAQGAFDVVVAQITQSEEWRQKHPGWTPLTPSGFQPFISFNRGEFLQTLERLDAFYSSQEGLQRPEGLSIAGGPDFLGIAAWIFDVYLNSRLQGVSSDAAWTQVVTAIRNTEEWRRKHP